MTLDVLQWLGCATGVFGSLLLAWRSRWSGWGFAAYLLSNICWIGYGVRTHALGLLAMQAVYLVTSAIGAWHWLLLPRRKIQPR